MYNIELRITYTKSHNIKLPVSKSSRTKYGLREVEVTAKGYRIRL